MYPGNAGMYVRPCHTTPTIDASNNDRHKIIHMEEEDVIQNRYLYPAIINIERRKLNAIDLHCSTCHSLLRK